VPKFESKQFQVNEAWVVFRISEYPVRTEADGDFHVLGLMDAASGYMLGTEFVPSTTSELSQFQAKHILKNGYTQSSKYPALLIIHRELGAKHLEQEAKSHGIEPSHASMLQLWPIIGEAVEGFRQHIVGGGDKG
jgi:hypothetical protein